MPRRGMRSSSGSARGASIGHMLSGDKWEFLSCITDERQLNPTLPASIQPWCLRHRDFLLHRTLGGQDQESSK
ncbi:hypothetical protein E2C01_053094 [Portunus trituberculatus]|uniref:Uncharacterized protein n=1 Tax=Portunus trituberculatus TaxID=210409 RepID=A0A5B7GN99_PORTR|nr:hypothetical protein [Portunus trituberculatus]